jgi:hypothetical protein
MWNSGFVQKVVFGVLTWQGIPVPYALLSSIPA